MSCSQHEGESTKKIKEYAFPVFVDEVELTVDTVEFNTLYHGNHYPMYFGKLKDTIIVDHEAWPKWARNEDGSYSPVESE